MLRYVRTRSPKEWVKQHQLLAAYYESLQNDLALDDKDYFEHPIWLAYEQERLYHLLCAKPDAHTRVILASVVKKWQSYNFSDSAVFGETLFDAGTDNDHIQVKGWGLRIRMCIQEYKIENYTPLQQIIEDILQKEIFKGEEVLAFLYYLIGQIFDTKKEYDQAIANYEKAIAIKPDYLSAYNNMGLVYDAKRDKDKTIASYAKAIAIKPDDHSAYNSIGFALIKFGDIHKAELHLHKAVDLGSLNVGNMNLGHIYLCEGDKEKAIDCYKTSLSYFEDKEVFWKGMQDDLQYLTQYGITEAYYQSVLDEVKGVN